jgi:hypothetical protein
VSDPQASSQPSYQRPWLGCDVGSFQRFHCKGRYSDGESYDAVAEQRMVGTLPNGAPNIEIRNEVGQQVSGWSSGSDYLGEGGAIVRRRQNERCWLGWARTECEVYDILIGGPLNNDERIVLGKTFHDGGVSRVWLSLDPSTQNALVRQEYRPELSRFERGPGGQLRKVSAGEAGPYVVWVAARVAVLAIHGHSYHCTVLRGRSLEAEEMWDCPGIPGGPSVVRGTRGVSRGGRYLASECRVVDFLVVNGQSPPTIPGEAVPALPQRARDRAVGAEHRQ